MNDIVQPQLYVIRHGDTEAAKLGLEGYMGRRDIPLANEGREQMRLLGEQMLANGTVPDVLLTSWLRRASESGAVLGEAVGLTPIIVPGFEEMHFGICEGLTKNQVLFRHPWIQFRAITDWRYKVPGGGESFNEVTNRVRAGLNAAAQEYPGRNIGIVTHGAIAKVIHAMQFEGSRNYRKEKRRAVASYSLERGAMAQYTLSSLLGH